MKNSFMLTINQLKKYAAVKLAADVFPQAVRIAFYNMNLLVFHWKERERIVRRRNCPNQDTALIICGKKGDMKGLASLYYEVMGAMYFCGKKKWKLYVDFENAPCQYSTGREIEGTKNAWEYFFLQPDGTDWNTVSECKTIVLSGWTIGRTVFDLEKYAGQMLTAAVSKRKRYADRIKVQDYIVKKAQNIQKELFRNEKVLGCLIRGTDYIQRKPKGHPIQPSFGQVLEKINDFCSRHPVSRIFAATEDEDCFRQLKAAYGDMIVCSDYEFVQFHPNEDIWLADSFQDDPYERGMRYLVRLLCLSGCQYFLAGNTSGSQFVLDHGDFEETYIFHLGVYE